jgi:hypothetical protein
VQNFGIIAVEDLNIKVYRQESLAKQFTMLLGLPSSICLPTKLRTLVGNW